MKTKERLDELEAKVDHLIERMDSLRDYVYEGDFKKQVAYALQDMLDTHQAITIRHYLNGKEITTKIVKDELKELKQQQSELEWALEQIKDIRQKYENSEVLDRGVATSELCGEEE